MMKQRNNIINSIKSELVRDYSGGVWGGGYMAGI